MTLNIIKFYKMNTKKKLQLLTLLATVCAAVPSNCVLKDTENPIGTDYFFYLCSLPSTTANTDNAHAYKLT